MYGRVRPFGPGIRPFGYGRRYNRFLPFTLGLLAGSALYPPYYNPYYYPYYPYYY